jgi:hypothetical protein
MGREVEMMDMNKSVMLDWMAMIIETEAAVLPTKVPNSESSAQYPPLEQTS